jgi:hypothetical protein
MFTWVCGYFAGSLQAQTDSINIVSTAVPFLRISPDARAGGMGDLAIATSPDANAPFWNLAKVPFAKKRSAMALNYTPWLKDLGLKMYTSPAWRFIISWTTKARSPPPLFQPR